MPRAEPAAPSPHASRRARKRYGVYYTPPALAHALAARTLAPLLRDGAAPRPPSAILALRVVDPALGDGAFLRAAYAVLAAALAESRRVHGEPDRDGGDVLSLLATLHGLELDAAAVAAARSALLAAAGHPAAGAAIVAGNLRAGDGLLDEAAAGADVVLGNPPWENLKPDARAFLRDHGIVTQGSARAALTAAPPPLRSAFAAEERDRRARRAALRRRYHMQGSGDPNLWKLFLERAVALLRPGGRLGLIVPAALLFDAGAGKLRRLLLDSCALERLVTFENRDGIFPIHRSFTFAALVATRGGATRRVSVAFHRRSVADLDEAAGGAIDLERDTVERFSPWAGIFIAARDRAQLALLERIHAAARPLGESGLAPGYRRELDLTADACHFVAPQVLQQEGATHDDLGRWLCSDGRVFLPLLVGASIEPFALRGEAVARPRFAVEAATAAARAPTSMAPRLALRDVQNATNERTLVATIVPPFPCGNTLPVLSTGDLARDLALLAVLSSFVVDFVLRLRMNQNHVNWFHLRELPLPPTPEPVARALARSAAALALRGPWFAPAREALGATTVADPRRRRGLRARQDAVVARLFGLSQADLATLLADCDHPPERLAKVAFRRGLDAKGFFRVDRGLEPHERHTVRTCRAFAALERRLGSREGVEPEAIEAFLEDDGDTAAACPRAK